MAIPWQRSLARRYAGFLVEKHGFVLEFDGAALSPHEGEMWRTLRYRRGDTTVEIVNTDIRVQHEWSIRLNGDVVASDWGDFEPGLIQALDDVARRISGRAGHGNIP